MDSRIIETSLSNNSEALTALLTQLSPSPALLSKLLRKLLKQRALLPLLSAQTLIAHGADPLALSKKKETLLMLAAAKGDYSLTHYFLSCCSPKAADASKQPTLFYAIRPHSQDPADIVRLLLDTGADSRSRDPFNSTPLHYAALYNYRETIKVLVEHKANLDFYNKAKDTPLHWATRQGCLQAVKELCNSGCYLHPANKVGVKPLDEASGVVLAFLKAKITQQAQKKQKRHVKTNKREEVKTDAKCSECASFTTVHCFNCFQRVHAEGMQQTIKKLMSDRDSERSSRLKLADQVREAETNYCAIKLKSEERENYIRELEKKLYLYHLQCLAPEPRYLRPAALFIDHSLDLKKDSPAAVLQRDLNYFLIDLARWHDGATATYEAIFSTVKEAVLSVFSTSEVKSFGSYATGLILPSSDLDIVILTDTPPLEILSCLSPILRDLHICKGLDTIFSAHIPLIKLTTNLNNSIVVDISVFTHEHKGLATLEFVNKQLTTYPSLRPVYLFLKQLLYFTNFNESYKGGLGSFSLLLLVVHYLQRHSIAPCSNAEHIGEVILGILYYFAWGFDYNSPITTTEQHASTKQFLHHSLYIKDPAYPDRNAAHSTDLTKLIVIYI